jgi:hypothetical protein
MNVATLRMGYPRWILDGRTISRYSPAMKRQGAMRLKLNAANRGAKSAHFWCHFCRRVSTIQLLLRDNRILFSDVLCSVNQINLFFLRSLALAPTMAASEATIAAARAEAAGAAVASLGPLLDDLENAATSVQTSQRGLEAKLAALLAGAA